MPPLVRPQVWRIARDRACEDRRLLVRAWWLILSLILVVAAIFHAIGSDVFPRVFVVAVGLGLACWLLVLAWSHGYYLFMSYFVRRNELREAKRGR